LGQVESEKMINKIRLEKLDGTFQKNKNEPIHRWYPFTEGYSDKFVISIIKEFADKSTYLVDPFAGSGTTLVTASRYGLKSGYCEINPFLKFVIETKVNSTVRLYRSGINVSLQIERLVNTLTPKEIEKISITHSPSEFDRYFKVNNLLTLLKLKKHIESFFVKNPDLKNISLLILSSLLVEVSLLKRAGDLRYKRKNEMKEFSEEDIIKMFKNRLYWVIEDFEKEIPLKTSTDFISEDALISKPKNKFSDLIVTSPPYLNGTNYIRNTKLELWFLGFLKNKSLADYHHKGVPSGINHVSLNRRIQNELPSSMLKVVKELEHSTYDRRIPKLILQYFDDMAQFFKNLSSYVLPTGYILIDIGDSIFAGVHIPTHDFLIVLAEKYGFRLENQYMIRSRRSRNGKYVGQYLLTFQRLNNTKILKDKIDNFITHSEKKQDIKTIINDFQKTLPYKTYPFNKRNWGHRYHSLCSYQSKLKPAIAHFLVKRFTKLGSTILDPFGGVGTIPLEAKLLGRNSYMIDLSPAAYIVAKAKLEYTTLNEIKQSFNNLVMYIQQNKYSKEILLDLDKYSNFGFNKKLIDYYHPETFREIIAARNWLKLGTNGKIKNMSTADAFVIAALLHILHGNRPYSLSRRSHPITPLAPTGPFEYRPIKERLWKKIYNSFDEELSTRKLESKVILGDAFKVSNLIDFFVDAIITSPPFMHSTRFHTNNWIRNWFCGWEPEDFSREKKKFIEVLQERNMDIYKDLLNEWVKILRPDGLIIFHLGSTKECDMIGEISGRIPSSLENIGIIYEFVKDQEAHGLSSQGKTVKHGFLFLKRKGE